MMGGFAHAAGMRRSCNGGQRNRNEIAHEREQQQKSGYQTVHVRLKMIAAYQLTDA
jgi:hypothetical protein